MRTATRIAPYEPSRRGQEKMYLYLYALLHTKLARSGVSLTRPDTIAILNKCPKSKVRARRARVSA